MTTQPITASLNNGASLASFLADQLKANDPDGVVTVIQGRYSLSVEIRHPGGDATAFRVVVSDQP